MVRRRVSAVSNHEAPSAASSFETIAVQAPQDEEMEPSLTQKITRPAITGYFCGPDSEISRSARNTLL
jgi:hypothetical protein